MPRGPTCRTTEEVLDYLRHHVYIDGDCLRWAGVFSSTGHPQFSWHKRKYMVLRLRIELETGRPLPPTRRIHMSCGNKWCVNRAHAVIGTHSQSLQNAARYGSTCAGRLRSIKQAARAAKTAKLPITERANVMRLRAEGWTYKQIGEKYGVSKAAVGYALKAWQNIYSI